MGGLIKAERMSPYRTNGIYYVDRPSLGTAKLERRAGHVELDEASAFDAARVDNGPLHVVRGLRPADLAVFFLVSHLEEGRRAVRSRIGYLVTDVSLEDGSGILVGKSHFDAAPGEWVSGHVEALGLDLVRSGFDFAEQFGLDTLQTYLTRNLPEN